MKKKTALLIGAAAAAGLYSAIKGRGPFNGIRFKKQHDSIARYIETHYPGALYSPIEKTEKGYVTVIKRIGKAKIILYVNSDGSGNFIFTECETANS